MLKLPSKIFAERPAFDFDVAARLLGVDRATLPETAVPAALVPTRTRIDVLPLADVEWDAVRDALPTLPVPRPGGFRDREFLDASLWHRAAKDRGFGWAALPSYFPPRATMQHRWHRWAVAGTWEDIALKLEGDGRLSAEWQRAFQRIAADAAQKRERVLANRSQLTEST